jgi:hypothetical protein
MAQQSCLDRLELFAATASVAAHANAGDVGFRFRDVKFLIELFSNWVESSFAEGLLEVQNTQVARYINMLVREGFARKLSRKGAPVFRLTRVGLIELLRRVVERRYIGSWDHVFFVFYFITNYRSDIEQLAKKEGREFPPSLKLELESLLDSSALLQRELRDAKRELQKLEERISAANSTSQLVTAETSKGTCFDEIVELCEFRHPYELNSLKPLSELISQLPEGLRRWELETGNLKRIEHIWLRSRALLCSYIAELENLLLESG